MDSRAIATLVSTYWSPAGWRPEEDRVVDPDELAHARAHGVMFDAVSLDHADIVAMALEARDRVDRRAVADAFVVSLADRELYRRSALGSYAVLSHFPAHSWRGDGVCCQVCGACNREAQEQDLNILSFERIKWGGVRHLDPLYAAFDLQCFQSIDPVSPRPSDVALLRDLLAAIDAVPARTTAAALGAYLPKTIKANKSEREILIGILGLCGVLETGRHPGFRTTFVPASARMLPQRHFVDMMYPACWWSGADGVNADAADYWFGHLLR